MSDDQNTQAQEDGKVKQELSLVQSIIRNSIGLGIFAFFTAGLIGITLISTQDTITQNKQDFQKQTLLELMPQGLIDSNLLNDRYPFNDSMQKLELLNLKGDKASYHIGFNNGEIRSIILPITAPDGYTGNIRMLCAISPSGDVLGVRVIEHKETPGLGDKIDIKKDTWITDFNTKNLDNIQWNVTKDGGDFDAFTGATITPRAVVKSIKRALEFYQLNQSVFLQHTANIQPTEQLIQE